jgi:hypothetical protein
MGYKQLIVYADEIEETLTEKQLEHIYQGQEISGTDFVISPKPRRLKEREYTILVDGNYKILEMKIGLASTKRTSGEKKNRAVIIRDSNLLIPSTLKGYGETLNKHYNTDQFSKLEIDGGYTRETKYNSYEEFINDGNEQEYLHQDVIILNEFLHLIGEAIPFNK